MEAASAAGDWETLARLVIAPLGLRADVRRLLVVPSGPLARVPFCLLEPGREVAYLPSRSMHALLSDANAERGEGVLAIAGPTRGSRARAEAAAVGQVVLSGDGATFAALEAALASGPRWRALHIACDSRISEERPTRSELEFDPPDSLRPIRVFSMRIRADLVVLAASKTALGSLAPEREGAGFVRAFLAAGAPRVLASIWNADDAATEALMVRFHALWKEGKTDAATALREAQAFVASQTRWSDPRHWAGWQLWGLP